MAIPDITSNPYYAYSGYALPAADDLEHSEGQTTNSIIKEPALLDLPTEVETLEEKVQKLFNDLLIKEWYLPGIGRGSQNTSAATSVKPVFSAETMRDIASIRAMIEKSGESDGIAPVPNLVFVGKPGVGKTIAVQHICETTAAGVGYIRIPSGAMEHHLKVSTAIPTLHKVFDVAEKCKKPVYLVMDDGEELVAKRPTQHKVREKNFDKAYWLVEKENFAETMQQRRTALVNAILEESGKDDRKVGFAITTNRPEVIDPAFMTRARVISFGKPGLEERKQIIMTHLPIVFKNDINYLSFFHKGRLENMAEKTIGFTGRNIVKMLEALYACVQMEKGDIRQDMIDACICEQAKAIQITSDAKGSSFKLPNVRFPDVRPLQEDMKAVTSRFKSNVRDFFCTVKECAQEKTAKIRDAFHQKFAKTTD